MAAAEEEAARNDKNMLIENQENSEDIKEIEEDVINVRDWNTEKT
jgi:hypothetical protein